MAANLLANLTSMSNILSATTTTLQATHNDPQKWRRMEVNITAMLETKERITADVGFLAPALDSLFRNKAARTAISKRLQAEHAACLAAYVSYLHVAAVVLKRQDEALVEQAIWAVMTKKGAAYIDATLQPAIAAFQVIWEFTCKTESVAIFLINACPCLSNLTALQSAIHAILSWLLRFLRGDTPALEVVRRQEKAAGIWHQGVLMLLRAGFMLFRKIEQDPGPATCSAVRALPQGLITTICCLVCEMSPPSGFALVKGPGQHLDVIDDVMSFLLFCRAHCNDEEPFIDIPRELHTLAAMEVAKLDIFVFSSASETHPQDVIGTEYILGCMISDFMALSTSNEQGAEVGGNASSPSTACGSTGSGGLYSKEMRPRVTLPNLLIMSAVHTHSLKHPQALIQATRLMGCMVMAWEHTRTSAQHVACLRLTLHHCAMHVGGWMQGQRMQSKQGASAHKSSPPSLPQRQQQQEMLQLQQLLLLSTKWWFTKEHIPKGVKPSLYTMYGFHCYDGMPYPQFLQVIHTVRV